MEHTPPMGYKAKRRGGKGQKKSHYKKAKTSKCATIIVVKESNENGKLEPTDQVIPSTGEFFLVISPDMQPLESINDAIPSIKEEHYWPPSSQDTQSTEDTCLTEEEVTPNNMEETGFYPNDPRTWSEAMVEEMIE